MDKSTTTKRIVHNRSFPAKICSCEDTKKFLREVCSAIQFSSLEMFQLELAIDEAFVNAADHGVYCCPDAEIDVSLIEEKNRITVIVKDFGGKPFNPTFFEKISERKFWGIGGRGIKIIKEIMDEVMYIFIAGKSTTLYMVKNKEM